MLDIDIIISLMILFIGTLYYDVKSSKILKITFLGYFYILLLTMCSFDILPQENTDIWSYLYDGILFVTCALVYLYVMGFFDTHNSIKMIVYELMLFVCILLFFLIILFYYHLAVDLTAIFHLPSSQGSYRLYGSEKMDNSWKGIVYGIIKDSFPSVHEGPIYLCKSHLDTEFAKFYVEHKTEILIIGGTILYFAFYYSLCVYNDYNFVIHIEQMRLEYIKTLMHEHDKKHWTDMIDLIRHDRLLKVDCDVE